MNNVCPNCKAPIDPVRKHLLSGLEWNCPSCNKTLRLNRLDLMFENAIFLIGVGLTLGNFWSNYQLLPAAIGFLIAMLMRHYRTRIVCIDC